MGDLDCAVGFIAAVAADTHLEIIAREDILPIGAKGVFYLQFEAVFPDNWLRYGVGA